MRILRGWFKYRNIYYLMCFDWIFLVYKILWRFIRIFLMNKVLWRFCDDMLLIWNKLLLIWWILNFSYMIRIDNILVIKIIWFYIFVRLGVYLIWGYEIFLIYFLFFVKIFWVLLIFCIWIIEFFWFFLKIIWWLRIFKLIIWICFWLLGFLIFVRFIWIWFWLLFLIFIRFVVI